ncbi:MAG: chemotaxis protein CheW [Myxococcales bacterium]|nr:chemotaxis protein CheW [Myxococcales bacterium]MCB9713777.1 chemotaxis protein CheW [Myxococcales bacterium]
MSRARKGRGNTLGRRLRGMVGTGADGGAYDDEREERGHDDLKLAGFYVGGAVYGIDIMRIKEVIQATPYPIRPVPHAPGIVEGVIQLRGVVIPVIDLRKRFKVEANPRHARLNKLIIVSVRGRIVGLKVDLIVGELRVPAGSLRPAPSMLRAGVGDIDEDFFSGVFRAEIRRIELRGARMGLESEEPEADEVEIDELKVRERRDRKDRKDRRDRKEIEEHMVFVVNLETVIDPARGSSAARPVSPTVEAERP